MSYHMDIQVSRNFDILSHSPPKSWCIMEIVFLAISTYAEACAALLGQFGREVFLE